jgi:hypothetical protein
MKTMFVASALIASMAVPAFAQTPDCAGQHGSYGVSRNYSGASAAYASRSTGAKRHVTRSRNVYSTRGRYIGSDPDPRVRDQLRRDPSQGGGNNQ